jgi:dipeptidyl aminopeptidase/acylaminoacyl peptidase
MIQGVDDPRCPVEQARIFRDRLLELGFEEGKDFEYVELEEGHMGWYTNIQSKIQQVKLIADFFDRKL